MTALGAWFDNQNWFIKLCGYLMGWAILLPILFVISNLMYLVVPFAIFAAIRDGSMWGDDGPADRGGGA